MKGIKLPKGKKIKVDFTKEIELTRFEKKMINYWINRKHYYEIVGHLIPISERLHLDFIGWNNEEYNDVLLCRSTRKCFT